MACWRPNSFSRAPCSTSMIVAGRVLWKIRGSFSKMTLDLSRFRLTRLATSSHVSDLLLNPSGPLASLHNRVLEAGCQVDPEWKLGKWRGVGYVKTYRLNFLDWNDGEIGTLTLVGFMVQNCLNTWQTFLGILVWRDRKKDLNNMMSFLRSIWIIPWTSVGTIESSSS